MKIEKIKIKAEEITFGQWCFIWDKLFEKGLYKALADHSRNYNRKWSWGL